MEGVNDFMVEAAYERRKKEIVGKNGRWEMGDGIQ